MTKQELYISVILCLMGLSFFGGVALNSTDIHIEGKLTYYRLELQIFPTETSLPSLIVEVCRDLLVNYLYGHHLCEFQRYNEAGDYGTFVTTVDQREIVDIRKRFYENKETVLKRVGFYDAILKYSYESELIVIREAHKISLTFNPDMCIFIYRSTDSIRYEKYPCRDSWYILTRLAPIQEAIWY